MTLKESIRQHALELGFNACRFAAAAPPDSVPHFNAWLDDGCHGTMDYLARQAERRSDPGQVLANAHTVVSLAISYHHAPDKSGATTRSTPAIPGANVVLTADPARGRVARYAQAADYHDVLAEPLRRLTRYIEEKGGAGTKVRAYADTGPILERDLGQRAGMGFVGKHTNLISRQLGNWFFLAEILTTLELEPDPPETNRCGNCVRCLSACPTGALTGPFRLDARLCISYLTIELKGPIPEQLRPAIGDRIFGCDDCLEVCPWNRFAREGRLMQEARRPDLHQPPLVELLDLDEATFRQRFRNTPLWRTKHRGLRRNVCVALGNRRDPAAIPSLQRASHDPDPMVAEHATWALDQMNSLMRFSNIS